MLSLTMVILLQHKLQPEDIDIKLLGSCLDYAITVTQTAFQGLGPPAGFIQTGNLNNRILAIRFCDSLGVVVKSSVLRGSGPTSQANSFILEEHHQQCWDFPLSGEI